MNQTIGFIEKLKARDPSALSTLIDTWSERLYNVILKITMQKEDAEELVQEVFIKAIKKIDLFEGKSTLGTWLTRIAINEALMLKRKEKQKDREIDFDALPQYDFGILLKTPQKLPEESILLAEFKKYFDEYLALVPEESRIAYTLKDIQGFSEDEVCEIMGITKAAMKNRVHRTRLFLKEKLEAYYGS